MQKISFTTSVGTIEIDDVNNSSIAGEKIFRLNEFDGNSVKNRIHSVQCIGMAGQRTLSAIPEVKTVTAKISFAPVYLRGNRMTCTGAAGMYALRREVLKRFPLGETGTLIYTNNVGEYEILARLDEIPYVSVKAGYLCECTLMFTADYPYWCRTVKSEQRTISGNYIYLSTANLGDVESPISGTIICNSSLEDTPDESGDYFRLTEGGDTNRAIHFVKPLEVYDELYFSLEYGNEFIVKRRKNYGDGTVSDWKQAFDYIDFPTNYEPCHVGAAGGGGRGTGFYFYLFTSGELSVQLDYRFLFTAI